MDFKMTYIIYNAENAILTHIMECKIDFDEPYQEEDLMCCICRDTAASLYCENDDSYFC